jgi:hypothetical protein
MHWENMLNLEFISFPRYEFQVQPNNFKITSVWLCPLNINFLFIVSELLFSVSCIPNLHGTVHYSVGHCFLPCNSSIRLNSPALSHQCDGLNFLHTLPIECNIFPLAVVAFPLGGATYCPLIQCAPNLIAPGHGWSVWSSKVAAHWLMVASLALHVAISTTGLTEAVVANFCV